jgi:hypothetical protein
MKAKTASLGLYHFEPGHHREANAWHDSDHRPEVVGTVPGVFISQRWVAPPDYVAARPPTDLRNSGGEYANLYWSERTPEDLVNDFFLLGKRLTARGRMVPERYMHRIWGSRMRVVDAYAAAECHLSPEAVSFAPHMGLVVTAEEIIEPTAQDDYERWMESERIPDILGSKLFTAAFKFVPQAGENQKLLLHYFYTPLSQAREAFIELQHGFTPQARATAGFPAIDSVRRQIFSGVYRPIIPGQYDFYD